MAELRVSECTDFTTSFNDHKTMHNAEILGNQDFLRDFRGDNFFYNTYHRRNDRCTAMTQPRSGVYRAAPGQDFARVRDEH